MLASHFSRTRRCRRPSRDGTLKSLELHRSLPRTSVVSYTFLMLIVRSSLNVPCRVALVLLALCGVCAAQKLAITFDDLPANGALPPGVTLPETAKDVLAILKKRH